MKFGIIGAGIVGTALAVRLDAAGHECMGVHTRSRHSYDRFRRYLLVDHLTLEELVPAVDSLFITTQDGVIRSIAEKLSGNILRKSGQAWIHCSGSLPAEILRVKEGVPTWCLSLHPLQAFASVEEALTILSGTHFGIEGDNEKLGVRIVKDLGGIPHHVSMEKKTLYHAGAVVASNYLVVLAALAVKLFAEAGIPEEDALAFLLPLMRGALYNLEQVGLPNALTGPIARGDVQVIQSHLDHLPSNQIMIYRALGLEALELGENKKAQQGVSYSSESYKRLKYLLEGGDECEKNFANS